MCVNLYSKYPCGHCSECLSRKRSDWSLRLQDEQRFHKGFHAILTYDNEHLPISKNGYPTLKKRDPQLFLKRLRHEVKDIKYFIAGEYGSRFDRPHYHIIIFGLDESLTNNQVISLLDRHWQNGFVRHKSKWVDYPEQLHYVTKDIINFSIDPLQIASWHLERGFCNDIDFDWWKRAAAFINESPNLFNQTDIESLRKLQEKINKYDDRLKPYIAASKFLGIGYVNEHKKDYDFSYLDDVRNPELLKDISLSYYSYFKDMMFSAIEEFIKYDSDLDKFYIDIPDLLHSKDIYSLPDRFHRIEDRRYFTENGVEVRKEVKNYALPRYWRDKLFNHGVRFLLNYCEFYESNKRRLSYLSKFKEYDSKNKVPMWLLQELNRYNDNIKRHKYRLDVSRRLGYIPEDL